MGLWQHIDVSRDPREPYTGAGAPTGQVLPREQYPRLYAALDNMPASWRGGEFKVPDLRERLMSYGPLYSQRMTGVISTPPLNEDTVREIKRWYNHEYQERAERSHAEHVEALHATIDFADDEMEPIDTGRFGKSEKYRRASGGVVCASCGQTYQRHPREIHYEAFNGEEMTLRRLCDGTLVKL